MKRMNEDYEPAFDFIVLRDRLPVATMNSPHRTRLRLGPVQLPRSSTTSPCRHHPAPRVPIRPAWRLRLTRREPQPATTSFCKFRLATAGPSPETSARYEKTVHAHLCFCTVGYFLRWILWRQNAWGILQPDRLWAAPRSQQYSDNSPQSLGAVYLESLFGSADHNL